MEDYTEYINNIIDSNEINKLNNMLENCDDEK